MLCNVLCVGFVCDMIKRHILRCSIMQHVKIYMDWGAALCTSKQPSETLHKNSLTNHKLVVSI